jgi:hypothetical protein
MVIDLLTVIVSENQDDFPFDPDAFEIVSVVFTIANLQYHSQDQLASG